MAIFTRGILTCDALACPQKIEVLLVLESGDVQFEHPEDMEWEQIEGRWVCPICQEKMRVQAPVAAPSLRKKINQKAANVQHQQAAALAVQQQAQQQAALASMNAGRPGPIVVPPVGQSAAQQNTVQIPPVGQNHQPLVPGLQQPVLATQPTPTIQNQVAPDGTLLPVPLDKMPFKFEEPPRK
jgi:hypothetical protein